MGVDRSGRGRGVGRRPLSRAARGLDAPADARSRERGRGDRRVAPRVRRRDADARRDRDRARAEGVRVTRLTMAQALLRFLSSQYVERDGVEQRFFAGIWGIFGHGNVAGIGEALFPWPDPPPNPMARNEQSMAPSAAG